MTKVLHYLVPIATIECELIDGLLKSLKFKPTDGFNCKLEDQKHPVIVALDNYFNKRAFNIPIPYILPQGTRFEKAIWTALKKIPYGKTVSYSELAKMAGYIGAARAAGHALSANLLPLILPCHRVIKSDGSLGGFSAGYRIKKWLLDFEFDGGN